MMAVKGDTLSAEAPATQPVRTMDGKTHTVPTFWRPEMQRERDLAKRIRDKAERDDPKLILLNTPFPRIAAKAAEWAQSELEAMNVVMPR
jgi:hypothetical protein